MNVGRVECGARQGEFEAARLHQRLQELPCMDYAKVMQSNLVSPPGFKMGFRMLGSPNEFFRMLLATADRLAGKKLTRVEMALCIYDDMARQLKHTAVSCPSPEVLGLSESERFANLSLPIESYVRATTSSGRGPGVRAYIIFLILEWIADPTFEFQRMPSQGMLLRFCQFLRSVFPKRKSRNNTSPVLAIGSCYNYLHGVHELYLRTHGKDIFHELPERRIGSTVIYSRPSLLLKLKAKWKKERNAFSQSSFAFSVQQRNAIVRRVVSALTRLFDEPLHEDSPQQQWDLETFLAAFLVACRMGLRISHYGVSAASVEDSRRLLTIDDLMFQSPDASQQIPALRFLRQPPGWLYSNVPNIATTPSELRSLRGLNGVVVLAWGPRHKALETGTFVVRPLFSEVEDQFCAFSVLTHFLLHMRKCAHLVGSTPVFLRGPKGVPVDGKFMNTMIRQFIKGVAEDGGVALPSEAAKYSSQSCRSFYLTMARERGIADEVALAYGQWVENSKVAKRIYDRNTVERFRPTVDLFAEELASPMQQRRRR